MNWIYCFERGHNMINKENVIYLARRARNEMNIKDGEKYYGMLILEEPDNWEFSFFYSYFQSLNCTNINIAPSASSFSRCLENNIKSISKISNDIEQDSALSEIVQYSLDLAKSFSKIAYSIYRPPYTNAITVPQFTAIHNIYLILENSLKQFFGDRTETIIYVLKEFNNYMVKYSSFFKTDYQKCLTKRLTDDICNVHPDYTAPESQLDHMLNKTKSMFKNVIKQAKNKIEDIKNNMQ